MSRILSVLILIEKAEYHFHNDVSDAYRGDVYGAIRATHEPSKKYVGKIDYAAGRGHVHVHMIDVDKAHQGKGLATHMMNHLKAEFPHTKVHWGMTTPEGETFKRGYYKHKQPVSKIDKLGYSYSQ